MHTVAYLRVSTGGQGLESQRLAILDYAQRPS
jgi:DNA invertase Pin-like site-specific DNA recombinase